MSNDLAAIGARFLSETRLSMGGGYHKDICFYAAGSQLFEIEHSYHDGLNCRIADAGETALEGFDAWPTLWERCGLTGTFPSDDEIARDPDALGAYIDQFPGGFDEMLRFIGTHLRGLRE